MQNDRPQVQKDAHDKNASSIADLGYEAYSGVPRARSASIAITKASGGSFYVKLFWNAQAQAVGFRFLEKTKHAHGLARLRRDARARGLIFAGSTFFRWNEIDVAACAGRYDVEDLPPTGGGRSKEAPRYAIKLNTGGDV